DPGRRIAEARGAHDIVAAVAKESPHALVVLGGDVHDTHGSEGSTALEEGGALLRVASDRPDTEVGTYVFGGSWQALDHLLFAPRGPGPCLPVPLRVARRGK